jgi:hypothetical protein
MRFRILLFFPVFMSSACIPHRTVISRPTRAFQTDAYLVVQTSPDRFLILAKSNAGIEQIQKQLGCGKPHICTGEWNGEMWTIERRSK